MADVQRYLWRSFGPTILLKQGHLKLAAQNHARSLRYSLPGWPTIWQRCFFPALYGGSYLFQVALRKGPKVIKPKKLSISIFLWSEQQNTDRKKVPGIGLSHPVQMASLLRLPLESFSWIK